MARPGRPRKYDPIANEISRAISSGKTRAAIALIQKSEIDLLDGDARTPLVHAALSGNFDALSWLIQEGANINHQDRNGWSALHFAVQEKHADAIRCLLENGAAVDIKDIHGNTPLSRAAYDARSDYELVRLLISHGADPKSKNRAGRSPVDLALMIDDKQLIAILKKK
jgi:ankyrin repeat protein